MPNVPHPQSRAPIGRGFSIVEIVLVTTIVAVVAAIALPRLHTASVSSRLAAAERVLLEELRREMHEANSHKRVLTIRFDVATDRVVVSDNDPTIAARTIDLADTPYRVTLAAANADGLGGDTITLDPTSDRLPSASQFTLALGGRSRTASISGARSLIVDDRMTLQPDRDRSALEEAAASRDGGSGLNAGGGNALGSAERPVSEIP